MKVLSEIPVSVLDLSPVRQGGTAAESFRNTLDLARHAERLGYKRPEPVVEQRQARHGRGREAPRPTEAGEGAVTRTALKAVRAVLKPDKKR